MFIDRDDELTKLEEITDSNRAELVLFYGRRRVGKSCILTEFAKKTKALYLLADASENILDILAKQVKEEFVRFNSWDDFFEFVYKSKHRIIIIDEFQYLYHINKAWPTILQRWWEKIKDSEKKIILCGSIISTIYKIAMGYGSALYGRKTHEIHITPIKFKFIKGFFPSYNTEQIIEAYSIVGGIPRYIEELDKNLDIFENIKAKILEKTSFLYNEPTNLLFEEFRTPAPYSSILQAISEGYVKFSEISEISKIQSSRLPKYLMILERVGLIGKEIPVGDKKIKIKTTRYKVKDNFYRFWFKFIFKNKFTIEQGLQDEVFALIKNEFRPYVGRVFEEVCKELIIEEKLFNLTKIGRWWEKDKEIDIIGLNEATEEIIFCECKWQEGVDAEKIIKELNEKTKYVKLGGKNRKEKFAVFAKSFKNRINEFEGKKAYCYDLKDIERLIKNL